MARGIFFLAIIVLIVMYSRETVAETTEDPSMADFAIAEHTWPKRLRAFMKILFDARHSILRFPKRIAGVRVHPLFILGILAMAATPARGAGAVEIVCYGPDNNKMTWEFPDLKSLGREHEEYIYQPENTGDSSSIKNCVDIVGLRCNFRRPAYSRCTLDRRCDSGYYMDEDSGCLPMKERERRKYQWRRRDFGKGLLNQFFRTVIIIVILLVRHDLFEFVPFIH